MTVGEPAGGRGGPARAAATGGAASRPVAAEGGARTGTRWTGEQWQAIALRGANLLVSAAAGAGKTSVLVERVVRRVLDPADPLDVDRVLVVTFTEAAAAQMKERIRERLEAALAQHPDDRRLRRQLALLGRASISTVHAFCLRIIRQYFYRLGLDPATKVAGEHEAQLLRHEVLDDLFERRYAAAAADFLALVEAYGGRRGDEDLRQLVLALYESAYAQPWPEAWLDALVRMYREAGADLDGARWLQAAREGVARRLQRHAMALAGLAAQCRRPGGPAVWADTLEGDARRLASLAAEAAGVGWEALGQILEAATQWPRLPGNPEAKANPFHKRIQRRREDIKRDLRGLREGLWARPAADVAADLERLAPHVATLVDLVKAYAASLQVAKRDRSLMDFTDMEHYALALLADPAHPGALVPSAVARELRRHYQEVLVDEYQDINPLQDAILRLVARDGEDGAPNLFLVGDVKQSIYAFRQAEPALFLGRYRAYEPAPPVPAPADAAPASGWRIELNANFRSRPAILTAVNDLFARLMVQDLGGLAYDEAARLRPRASFPDPPAGTAAGEAPVEVYVLERKPEALDDDLPDALAAGSIPVPGLEAADGGPAAGPSHPEAEAGLRPGEPAGRGAGEPGPELRDGAEEGDGEAGPGSHGTGDQEGSEDEEVDPTVLEREARLVAWRIRRLVEGAPGQPPLHVWDPDLERYRPVRYRDVVVLLRSAKVRAATFVEVMSRHGVPVYTRSRTGYLTAPEVEMVLALLQVLDNPRQDIPLAAVLRSPVVGLDADDLARIRVAARDVPFYEAVCRVAGWDPDREEPAAPRDQACQAAASDARPGPPAAGAAPSLASPRAAGGPGDAAAAGGTGDAGPAGGPGHARPAGGLGDAGAAGGASGPGDLRAAGGRPGGPAAGGTGWAGAAGEGLAERLRAFLADLARWRGLARRWPLSRVIQAIYDETGLLTFVAALPAGEQRRANLEALRDRARQFDRFARQGLFRFLRFIERLRERGDDLGTAPALGENEDVVRVMTIHQSKGLEFPVVVVADLGARFPEERGHALLHRELGLGLKVADPELRIRYPSLAYEAVRARQRLDTLAEELRILYVALTRARERLILVGSVRDLPTAAAAWWAAAGGWAGDGRGPEPLPAAILEGARSFLDWIGTALIHHPDATPLRRLALGGQGRGRPQDPDPPGAPSPAGPGRGAVEPPPGPGWTSRWAWALLLRPAMPAAAPDDPAGPAPREATGPAPAPADGGPGDPSAAPPADGSCRSQPAASDGTGDREAEEATPGAVEGVPVPGWLEPLLRGEPLPPGAVDREAVEALRRRLAWRYPFAALANRFAKRSVSELEGRADPEWQAYPLPAELRRGLRQPRLDAAAAPAVGAALPLSGAERGTATHRVLQHLDLTGPLDVDDVARQIEAMVGRGLLTPAEAEVVDRQALARFFAGPLGRRLRRAPERVRREWMFTLGVPATELYPDLAAGGTEGGTGADADVVVVQGVVDCFVEEDDGLLLLDFKTDEPRGRTLEAMAALYAGQVRFYRRALREITGRPVKEAYLVFLAAGAAVPVP
ncbi:UvrD-helicase domain-containing protein [Thermaerobacter composti]|uniref:ATP-dependent helicase/nuclease subunit A n=1 Tax=Thermaerobacter composti TaxID=554949 RepID=A0ABZ0QRY2_9FIRM|nr:UvrD-helicase domain-containing protein [Thermaerobacter composti]WPD19793.1 UvrD-helicase domain-containing protein [Thermaerobacter composti]